MILIDTHTKLSIVSAFIILICYRIDTNFDTKISIDLFVILDVNDKKEVKWCC